MTQNLLELNGVCKRYPSFSLENVSFTLPGGSIMALIGENGAGKTTTLKLILNELRRDAGTVRIFGRDNLSDGIAVKEEIGTVFDESYFHGGFSAGDVGAILRGVYRGWDSALYRQYLDRFSLPLKKAVKEYSRGMKMKLSLASALAHRPRLLILDEATSGLDPVVRSEVLDLLLDFIGDEEHGVLFSSHITSDLERIADYVTFLHGGRVVFSEQKDDLLDRAGVLKCGASQLESLDRSDFLRIRRGAVECEALVANRQAAAKKYPGLVVDPASLDEIMVMTIKGEKA